MGQHGHGCGGHHPPGVPDVLHDQHWGLILSPSLPILFLFFANKEKLAEQMGMRILEVVTSAVKQNLPSNQLFLVLEIIANDLETDEEVELPYVQFWFC